MTTGFGWNTSHVMMQVAAKAVRCINMAIRSVLIIVVKLETTIVAAIEIATAKPVPGTRALSRRSRTSQSVNTEAMTKGKVCVA